MDEKQTGGIRWRWKTRLLAAWGELSLARGDPQEALRYAEQCLELATQTSSRKNQAKAWKLRGEALMALGFADEAAAWLDKAIATAEGVGNPPLAWKSRYARGQALESLERRDDAAREYALAAAHIERTAANLTDPALRATFLAAAPVKAALAAHARG